VLPRKLLESLCQHFTVKTAACCNLGTFRHLSLQTVRDLKQFLADLGTVSTTACRVTCGGECLADSQVLMSVFPSGAELTVGEMVNCRVRMLSGRVLGNFEMCSTDTVRDLKRALTGALWSGAQRPHVRYALLRGATELLDAQALAALATGDVEVTAVRLGGHARGCLL